MQINFKDKNEAETGKKSNCRRIKIAIRSIYMLTGKIVDEKDEKRRIPQRRIIEF